MNQTNVDSTKRSKRKANFHVVGGIEYPDEKLNITIPPEKSVNIQRDVLTDIIEIEAPDCKASKENGKITQIISEDGRTITSEESKGIEH